MVRVCYAFFPWRLFSRLSCYTTKFSWCFFNLIFIPQLISRTTAKASFRWFLNGLSKTSSTLQNCINTKSPVFFIEFNRCTFWLSITTAISWTQWFCDGFDDIFFDPFAFFQNAEGFSISLPCFSCLYYKDPSFILLLYSQPCLTQGYMNFYSFLSCFIHILTVKTSSSNLLRLSKTFCFSNVHTSW